MSRVRVWHDGEVSEFPRGKGYIVYCCDCGLAHEFVFEGVRGDKARISVRGKPRLTASYRKRARLPMTARDNST